MLRKLKETGRTRGTDSKVEILVGGQVNRSFGKQTGTVVTRVQVPGNEQSYPVQLRVCNEKAPAGCTLSSQQNVQSYGPLDGMLNDIAAPVVNGRSVTWTIAGSSNGDPGQLVYRINGGAEQTIALSGVGAFSQAITASTEDFAQQIRLEVWLRDAAPGGRGEAFKESRAVSGTPQPGVSVTKGTSCTDGDTDVPNNCSRGPGEGNPPVCDVASCAFIRFSASGFYEDFTCSVSAGWTSYVGWRTYSFGPTLSGQITQDTDWYAPAGATVTCQGTGAFGRVASGSASW